MSINKKELEIIKSAIEIIDNNADWTSQYWNKKSNDFIKFTIISYVDAYFKTADAECLLEAIKVIGGLLYGN